MTAPAYPLNPPQLDGTRLTVDVALNNPDILTRRLADITQQRFIVDKMFATAGGAVAAGALVYEQTRPGDLFTTRDVEQRGPADEYPVVSGPRAEPLVALSEDWGGKFWTSDEARSRNDSRFLDQQVTQLANTLVRKINTRAVATLEASVDPLGDVGRVAGNDWDAFITGGATPTPNRQQPLGDFAKVQHAADADELGVVFDLWLIHPDQDEALKVGYGAALADVLISAGIETFASNRVAPGTAYAVARGQVGFLEFEKPLTTEIWRDPATRRTWTQSYVQPVIGVTNPFAVRKVIGLA